MLINKSVRLNSNKSVRGNIREEQGYVPSLLARPSDDARTVGSPSTPFRINFNNLKYSVLLRILGFRILSSKAFSPPPVEGTNICVCVLVPIYRQMSRDFDTCRVQ
jgi:hypothetical protein